MASPPPPVCALCAEVVGADPDALALVCKNGHDDRVHDRCWRSRYSNEAYKKAQHGESTKYGRGPAKERCLHDGCASFVKIKSVGKVTLPPDVLPAAARSSSPCLSLEQGDEMPRQEPRQGGSGSARRQGGGGSNARKIRKDEGEYEEDQDEDEGHDCDDEDEDEHDDGSNKDDDDDE